MSEETRQENAPEIFSILNPGKLAEAIIMIIIAICFDLAGIVLFFLSFAGIGILFSLILDIAGAIIFSAWLFLRSGEKKVVMKKNVAKAGSKKLEKGASKVLKGLGKRGIKMGSKMLKRLLPMLGLELIPFAGDLIFCYTFFVVWEIISD